MKKKILSAILAVMSLSFLLIGVSCNAEPSSSTSTGGSSSSGDDVPALSTVADVIAGSPAFVQVEGTVFAKAKKGFFLDDGTASVYVQSNDTVNIGDKTQVVGQYAKVGNRPSITYSDVSVEQTAQTVKTATENTVSSVLALDGTAVGSYSQLYTVEGVLSLEKNNEKLTDGENVLAFSSDSDLTALADFDGKKVQIDVVTYSYTAGDGWEVVFSGDANGVEEVVLDVATVKDEIFAAVAESVPEKTWIAFDLTTSYASAPSVAFNWSVTAGGAAMSVADNVMTLSSVSEQTSVTLTLTLTSGKTQASETFEVAVMPVRTVDLAAVSGQSFEENEYFYTTGTVVTKSISYGGEYSLILSDITSMTSVYERVDLSGKEECDLYAVGDEVKVLGSYQSGGTGMMAIESASTKKTPTAPVTVDYESLPSISVETATDYETTICNYTTNTVKLLKVVNPYMSYSNSSSASTNGNYVRFGGYSGATAKNGGYSTGSSMQFYGLYITAHEYLGVGTFFEELNLSRTDNTKQYVGYTLYVFSVYTGATSTTTWQLILPSTDAVVISEEEMGKVEVAAAVTQTTFDASTEGGTIELPSETEHATITSWTSSDTSVFDPETGIYGQVTGSNKTVTLSATFTVNGNSYSAANIVTLTFTGAPIEYLTVSEALAEAQKQAQAGDDPATIDFLEATVAGVASGHGGTITSYPSSALYLTDGTDLIALTTVGGNLAKNMYVYSVDGTAIATGDKIRLSDLTLNGTSKELTAGSSTVASIESSGNSVDMSGIAAETIDTNEKLASYVAPKVAKSEDTENYKVYKIVATESNPIYIGMVNAYTVTYYFGEAIVNPETDKVTAPHYALSDETPAYPAAHSHAWAFAVGREWVLENTPTASFITDGYGSTYTSSELATMHAFTGTFYFVSEYTTSISKTNGSVYLLNGILGLGFNLTALSAAQA